MPSARHEVAKEVKHQGRLQRAHKEVVALDVHFELGKDLQCLPATHNSDRLQCNDYE